MLLDKSSDNKKFDNSTSDFRVYNQLDVSSCWKTKFNALKLGILLIRMQQQNNSGAFTEVLQVSQALKQLLPGRLCQEKPVAIGMPMSIQKPVAIQKQSAIEEPMVLENALRKYQISR